MRAIVKGQEPRSLVECRSVRPKLTYADYRDIDTLRQSLVKEQRGICCYCMGRIRANEKDMKVEHWRPQRITSEQLNYGNLLGACKGIQSGRPKLQHCDTSKGDKDLSRNPADPHDRIESLVRFGTDGIIRSDDAQFDHELNEVLNLNLDFLKRNRKAQLDGFIASLPKQGKYPEALIHKELAYWNGDSHAGELEPYCQVVVGWLRSWLQRRAK